jgi:hypothetical protein
MNTPKTKKHHVGAFSEKTKKHHVGAFSEKTKKHHVGAFSEKTKKHHVVVGDEGFEPPTSSLSVTRSNQLS